MRWLSPIVIVLLNFCFVSLSGCYQPSAKISPQGTVETLIRLLVDRDIVIRRTAAEALGKIGFQQAGPSLVVALADPAAIVREAALHSLGQLGSLDAITTARMAVLLTDPVPSVRIVASQTLASLDSGKELWPLWRSQLAHEDPGVRSAVIHALEGVGSAVVVEALSGLIADPDSGVRRAAVVALGDSGDMRAVPLLHDRLKSDPSPYVRAEAAYQLQFISGIADAEVLRVASRSDDSAQVRRWADQTSTGMTVHGSDSMPLRVPPAVLGPSHRYP